LKAVRIVERDDVDLDELFLLVARLRADALRSSLS
jgi:hypothetical protein